MPPQRLPEMYPAAGKPAPPGSRHGRRWLVWLTASLVLAVTAALVVASVVLKVTGSPTPPGADAASAKPADIAATSGSSAPAAARQSTPTSAPPARPSASPSARARPEPVPNTLNGWPNADNTGVPAGVTLRPCRTRITSGGTYDRCRFEGDVDVRADHVKITRSLIKGSVNAGSGDQQTGLLISDSTIDCGCLSTDTQTPSAIMESNYTLLRVNLFNSGHGAAVKNNVKIQDSYIHGLGADNDAHKDGIYSGDGSNVTIRHNNITCNDGSHAGCTSAIGLLTDFGTISHWTIDHNLLNTNGAYCFYGNGGPQKPYTTHHIVFVNNHFGRSIYPKCGAYGPVAYFDANATGNVWSGNVWEHSGARVPAAY